MATVDSGQWTVDMATVESLVGRVTFPTLAASLPPAAARPATLATATDAPVTGSFSKY